MRKLFALGGLAVAVTGLAVPATATPRDPTDRGTLVTAIPLRTLATRADVAHALTEAQFDPAPARHGVDTWQLIYRTIDPQGHPTVASGLLALPRNGARQLRTVSYTHGTELNRLDAPSLTADGWGVAPALAAGNTVIAKPAELTPLTAIRIGELALEAGIPEHVFQVLPGEGPVAGRHLVSHPGVRKIVFTGSTRVGKEIMAACATDVKRLTLELGGKSSNIVFADAALADAAARATGAVFDNAGQDCCARSRLLVEQSAYDQFMELFEAAVRSFAVGDPLDEKTDMGPLISAAQRTKVASYVGPDVAFQGSAPEGPGFWFPPTVLTGPAAGPAWNDEIFGPVVTVVPFADEAEAISLANDTVYGLSGSIWTRDLGRGLRMARAVDAGNLSVNSNSSVRYTTPFGGFKQSGFGRELGPDALNAFTDTKNVFISTD
jgi:acyl-CoA reductase-like NAD-dependent aldehyde dehydrogenase